MRVDGRATATETSNTSSFQHLVATANLESRVSPAQSPNNID